jgi:hypothetical protein
MTLQAVLTGDIVNSTKLTAAKEAKLARTIINLFAIFNAKIEFYRGDSFQAYVKKPVHALRLALLSRAAAIKLFKEEKLVLSDVRISIGVGVVKAPVRSLKTAKGEAFILSGRKFDEISKTHQRLAISTTHTMANEGLQVMADYLNSIFNAMTGKQAEVIFELLKGETQKAVAKKIKKTKSTIHQRSKSGRWEEIERILQQYENIINQIAP